MIILATSLILILKITKLSNLALKVLRINNNKVVIDSSRINKTVKICFNLESQIILQNYPDLVSILFKTLAK